MFEHLNRRGKEFGIVFGDRTLLSNSRLALEASEYARDSGKHEVFHARMFHAYFTDGADIGRMETIAAVAAGCGLDPDEMAQALRNGRYLPRLEEARKEGAAIQLTGVPTFIIDRRHKIVGAQPQADFERILDAIVHAGNQ